VIVEIKATDEGQKTKMKEITGGYDKNVMALLHNDSAAIQANGVI